MENLKSQLTNLYKIEGILFVKWATYAEPEGTQDGPASEGLGESIHLILDKAEHELRRNGHHVLQDGSPNVLWHFILSGPAIAMDPRGPERLEDAAGILAKHQLKRISSGYLKRSDIAWPLHGQPSGGEDGRARSSRPSTPLANNSALQHNTTLDVSVTGQSLPRETSPVPVNHEENLYIFERIRIAVLNSVIYAQVSKGLHIPLSPSVLISRKSLVSHDFEFNGGNRDTSLESRRCFSIKVAWFSDGTVYILESPASVESLWWLDDYKPYNLDEVGLSSVVMAPTGLIASIIAQQSGPFESATSSLGGKPLAFDYIVWQNILRSWLRLRGITLLEDDEWVWVVIADSVTNVPDLYDLPPSPILWPRELCYDTTDITTTTIPSGSEFLRDPTATDVLSKAEAWFSSAAARKELAEPQALEKLQNLDSGNRVPKSDDDIFSELLRSHESTLERQAVSGIYPTPPEGTRAQGYQTTDHRAQNNQHDGGDHSNKQTRKEQPAVALEATSAADQSMIDAGFNDIGGDDLFGNLGECEYADNGITEDDFSFFDDPGQSLPEKSNALAHAIKGESIGKGVQTNETTLEVGPVELPLVDSEIQAEKLEHESVNRSLATLESPKSAEDTSMLESHSLKVSFASEEHLQVEDPELNSSDNSGKLPLNNAKLTAFDIKYGKAGKSSFVMRSQPSTLTPWIVPRIENSIPIINNSDSLSVSEMDDDDRLLARDVAEDSENDTNMQSLTDTASPKLSAGSPQTSAASPEIQTFSTEGEIKALLTSPEDMILFIHLLEVSGAQMEFQRNQIALDQRFECDMAIHAMDICEMDIREKADLAYYIQLFQLVADQIIHHDDLVETSNKSGKAIRLESKDTLMDMIDRHYPPMCQCTLETWLSLGEDDPESVPTIKFANRPALKRHDTLKSDNDSHAYALFPLAMPDVHVRRGAKKMEMSCLALEFWEELGLSPFAGPKNVIAFCIYPEHDLVRRGAASFLSEMCNIYTSLRLGSHSTGHASLKEYKDGLVPLPIDGDPREGCKKFGKSLLPLASLKRTIVLYMVNESQNRSSIKAMCSYFLHIFHAYARVRHVAQPSDLVLRVLPISWIAAPTTNPISPRPDFARLSKEVYDRCPGESSSTSPYASQSFTELAEPLPKSLEFKVSPDADAGPFQQNSFAHLAYCWDTGSGWLTTAMTDNNGCHIWKAAFHMRQHDESYETFSAVFKEMLEVAEEAVKDAHGKPRIIVVKDKPMKDDESRAWIALSAVWNSELPLVLVNLDPSPPLLFPERPRDSPQFDINQVVTPLPGTPEVASPGLDLNSPRFPEESDPEARLTKISEETWAATSNRQISINGDDLKVPPSVSCGYLVKHGQATLGIRILHSETDVDAKSLLRIYHSLTYLSQARGFPEELPWHVAVARRAQSGLCLYE